MAVCFAGYQDEFVCAGSDNWMIFMWDLKEYQQQKQQNERDYNSNEESKKDTSTAATATISTTCTTGATTKMIDREENLISHTSKAKQSIYSLLDETIPEIWLKQQQPQQPQQSQQPQSTNVKPFKPSNVSPFCVLKGHRSIPNKVAFNPYSMKLYSAG